LPRGYVNEWAVLALRIERRECWIARLDERNAS
jgi:hypothetical protein